MDTPATAVRLVDEQAANRKLSRYTELAADFILQACGPSRLKTFVLLIHLCHKILHHLTRTEKLHSFFSTSQFLFSVSALIFRDSLTKDGLDQ